MTIYEVEDFDEISDEEAMKLNKAAFLVKKERLKNRKDEEAPDTTDLEKWFKLEE